MVRVAINGFGRIGRLVLRALRASDALGREVELVAIADVVPPDNLAYLLKYDSVQGKFEGTVSSTEGALLVDGRKVSVVSAPSLEKLPWREMQVDFVVESSGLFTDGARARGHLTAGAKRVIITAPAKHEDLTVVMGVNHEKYDRARHAIVSNASCTTYGLAPLVYVLVKEGFGVSEGLMTSVHSYTASQRTVDGPSRKDWRGGRAAAVNTIPASTGAARAIGKVIPEVEGVLTGMAFRVPTPTVSVVDFSVRTKRDTTLSDIAAAIKRASETYLSGILGYSDEELVSSDFVHDARSSIYDAPSSLQVGNRFFKLVSWYDNEWAYANRCADLLRFMAGTAVYANGIRPARTSTA